LTIHVQEGKGLSLQQIREFLEASDEIHFKGKGRAAIYAWVARTLGQHGYNGQVEPPKGCCGSTWPR
jgi:lysophospholipase L1-like esterase